MNRTAKCRFFVGDKAKTVDLKLNKFVAVSAQNTPPPRDAVSLSPEISDFTDDHPGQDVRVWAELHDSSGEIFVYASRIAGRHCNTVWATALRAIDTQLGGGLSVHIIDIY